MCCNFYFLTWERFLVFSWILNFMWGERFECQLFSFDLCCSCTVHSVTLVKCFFKAIGLYPYICNVSFTKHVFLVFCFIRRLDPSSQCLFLWPCRGCQVVITTWSRPKFKRQLELHSSSWGCSKGKGGCLCW